MVLTCHELGDCQPYGYAIAVWCVERFFEAFHGSFLISQRTQSLASGDVYCAFSSLLIRFRRRPRFRVLLCQLHVVQGLIPIVQLRVRPCKLCVNQRIGRGKFLGRLQFVNRLMVLPQAVQRIGQRQMKSLIIGRIFQGGTIFGSGLHQQSVLPIGGRPNQVNGHRITHLLFRKLHLSQGDSGTMHIQAGVGQPQMSFAILRFELEGRFEIRSGSSRLVQVMQHVSAVHIRRNHVGIALQGFAEIFLRLLQISILFVHIAS